MTCGCGTICIDRPLFTSTYKWCPSCESEPHPQLELVESEKTKEWDKQLVAEFERWLKEEENETYKDALGHAQTGDGWNGLD